MLRPAAFVVNGVDSTPSRPDPRLNHLFFRYVSMVKIAGEFRDTQPQRQASPHRDAAVQLNVTFCDICCSWLTRTAPPFCRTPVDSVRAVAVRIRAFRGCAPCRPDQCHVFGDPPAVWLPLA